MQYLLTNISLGMEIKPLANNAGLVLIHVCVCMCMRACGCMCVCSRMKPIRSLWPREKKSSWPLPFRRTFVQSYNFFDSLEIANLTRIVAFKCLSHKPFICVFFSLLIGQGWLLVKRMNADYGYVPETFVSQSHGLRLI